MKERKKVCCYSNKSTFTAVPSCQQGGLDCHAQSSLQL